MSIIDDKRDLRVAALQRRNKAAAQLAGSAGSMLRDLFLARLSLPAGTAISFYWPMRNEIDPRPLVMHLHRAGHPCALPHVIAKGQPLGFRAWHPGLVMIKGSYGELIPGPEQPSVRPDILLVPFLAFDRRGYRLGYGGGYYDRTITALRETGGVVAIGVGFGDQEVSVVPSHDRDAVLDWVVTEREAIHIPPRPPSPARGS